MEFYTHLSAYNIPLLEIEYVFSPEEKIRQLEKKVNELIEESCFANSRGEFSLVCEIIHSSLLGHKCVPKTADVIFDVRIC